MQSVAKPGRSPGGGSTRRPLLRAAKWLLPVCLVVAVVSGVFSGSASAMKASKHAKLVPLKVDVLAPTADFGPLWVALSKNMFAKAGLNVTVNPSAGLAGISELLSGQVDLAFAATTSVIPAQQQGGHLSVIYAEEGQPGEDLVSEPNITSIAQLRATSPCTIASFATGSEAYATAELYVRKLGLTNCTIAPQSSLPLVLASVTGGRAQAAVVGAASVLGAPVKILVDTRSKTVAKQYLSPQYPVGCVEGVAANLRSKRASVVKFLEVLNQAAELFHADSASLNASILGKLPWFETNTYQSLTLQVQAVQPYMYAGLAKAAITKGTWHLALNEYKAWGIPGYDATNPALSYQNFIDMSYQTAAIGALPPQKPATKKKSKK